MFPDFVSYLVVLSDVVVFRSLKGVPLAYDSIRIVGQHGDIYDDSGYIHMDIVANFIVFQPTKGQKLVVRFTITVLDILRDFRESSLLAHIMVFL